MHRGTVAAHRARQETRDVAPDAGITALSVQNTPRASRSMRRVLDTQRGNGRRTPGRRGPRGRRATPRLSVQNTRTKFETVRVFWTLNSSHAGTAQDAGPDAGTPALSVHDTPDAGRGMRRVLDTRPGGGPGAPRAHPTHGPMHARNDDAHATAGARAKTPAQQPVHARTTTPPQRPVLARNDDARAPRRCGTRASRGGISPRASRRVRGSARWSPCLPGPGTRGRAGAERPR